MPRVSLVKAQAGVDKIMQQTTVEMTIAILIFVGYMTTLFVFRPKKIKMNIKEIFSIELENDTEEKHDKEKED